MPIQSVYGNPYLNGGMIGAKLLLNDETRYIVSQETVTYVGGLTASGPGTTSTINVTISGISMQEGDLVIVAFATGSTTDISYRISDGTTDYTQIADLFANDTYDTNLQVGYKFMDAEPDSTVRIPGGSGSANDAYTIAVHVWRGVDTTSPMDVTPVTLTQTNTALVNPPAITPVTTGAQILIAGAGAHSGGVDTYTASYLSNFLTVGNNDVNDSSIGLGSIAWTGGTYDGAAWTFSQADSTSFSCASCVMALRPLIVYGNKKNSGVWNTQAVFDSLTTSPAFAGYSLVTSTSASSRTVPVPTAARPGDLLVAVFYEMDGRTLVSGPDGWTAGPSFSNSNASIWLYYKTMQFGDYYASARISSSALFGAIMVAFRASTYDTGQAVYDSDGVVNFSGITVTNSNSILCIVTASGNVSFTALSSPWVTIVNQNSSEPYAYSTYQEGVASGATGAIAVTGGSGTKGGGVLFAMSYTGGA